MAKNNEVGVALLRIAPSLEGFTKELKNKLEALQKSQAWPKAEVNLDLGNTKQFQAKVEEAVQRAERREVNINVDVNTGKARAEVEAFKRAAERRGLNLDLHIDDGTTLDDLRRQMRSVHEIREDIARAAAEAASSDKESSDEARERLGLLRGELKLVNDIEAAQKAAGDRAAADRIDERKHLKDRLDGLRAASDIERDILDAKARGDDSARIAAEKELATRKQISSAIQTYERERVEAAQRAADMDARARQHTSRDLADRLGAMRKESDIRRDMADAQLRGDKAHLASLNRELQLRNGLASALRAQVREQRVADQDRRRAAEAEARDRDRGNRNDFKIGVVQNFRGLSASGLLGVSSALAGVNALVAALGGVVAAAGAAATALASMGAVGLVGGMGVFKAFSALRQEADSAGSAVEDSANDQARAMDRLADAQRSVQDAQRDLRDSQKDYATAVKDATRAIRDQNMELQDAVLSQEDAAIGVARARERLAEVNADFRAGRASKLDVQEARLGVRQAQARLTQSQQRVSDAREDTAEVNAGGVEGHEIVENARERIDDSHRRLADAQRDVARATRDMAQAMRQAQGPQSEFDKQMAKLAPNARDFVNRVRSLSGAWDKLRFATEQAMFDGLGAEVQKFAGDQLPDLQRGMEALAGTMNTVFKDTLKQVGDTFSQFAADGTFSRFITSVQDSFAGFAPTIDALIRTLTGLTIEIGPQIGVFFQQFADFLNDGTQMWAEFGRETVAGIGGMLPVINDLFESLLPIAAALLPYFAEALQVLTNVISDNEGKLVSFNDALGSAFVKLLEAALPLLIGFADAMSGLLRLFASLPPGVVQWFLGIGGAIFIAMRGIIGLGNTFGRIGTALQTIKTGFLFLASGKLFTGIATGIAKVGIALKTTFMSMTPMGKFITGIMLLVSAFVLAYQRSEGFRNAVNKVKDALANMFGGSDNAMAAATFAPLLLGFTKLTGGASLFSKALGPLKVALGAVTTGIRTMTVAMLTNPIGIIIAAVVALGVALWAFFTKTETGRKIWAGFVGFLKKVWEGFKEAFGKVVDWIGDRWNGLVKFFTENKWIRALLNPIDTLKRGFQGMFDFAKGLFGNLKRILLEMLLAPARAVGRLFQKVPTWVPGSGRVRSFGAQLASVQVVERREGGTIPKAVSRANNVLKGPGTPTSDSIIAVDDAGIPVARVSTDEGIVNAKGLRKHRGLFEAINRDDPRLANLPGFDKGGALSDIYRPLADPPKGGGASPPSQEGSAKQRLGAKAWDLEWQKYFREKGADTPQKAYDYMQTHLDVRDRYRRGDLPPAPVEGGWFEKMTPRKDDDKIAEDQRRRNDEQRIKEVKEREKREADRKRARKLFDEAWYKWFEEHGGDDNKESYLARNPDVAERWRSGVFPPGDERRQEDLKFNPDGSLSDESKPFDMDGGVGDVDLGGPTPDLNIDDTSNWTPWSDGGGSAGPVEEYGLPPGTNTGGYGSSGDAFPPWVREMEAKWGVKSSTYPGHQESDRGEPGYAPNPKGLNRGIDWSGPVDAMQKFAEYLLSIAPQVQGLEQIIWQNPQTGQKIGWHGRTRDDGSYFASDYAGHQDHVHTRQSTSLPANGVPSGYGTDPNGTGADDFGPIDIENVDPGPDGILGTDDDIALDMGGSSKDSDPGIQESASISDAMINGVFSPRRFAVNVGAKATGILWDGALAFFGLENSILSENNTYTKAISDAMAEQDRVDKARKKKRDQYNRDLEAKDKTRQQYDPQTGNVGSGAEGTDKDLQLKMGYNDPTKAPQVQQAQVPKQTPEGGIAEGTPGAKEAVHAEWQRRGWTSLDEWFDTLRLINGESSWNATIRNPSSGAFGLFQFLGSTKDQYLPDENPNPAVQARAGGQYIADRPDYGTPSKAYAMWKSRSPHWYANGGYVSGPGGPRDDEIEARLSNGEFVVNAASTEKAGPLLEAINASPAAAEQALNMLSGPVGAALNGVAPGAGVAASAVLSQAGSVAESALRPAANTAIGFLSEVERSNFTARHQAPAQMTVEPKKHTPPMQKSFNSGTININTLDHRSMVREIDDMSARDAMRFVNI